MTNPIVDTGYKMPFHNEYAFPTVHRASVRVPGTNKNSAVTRGPSASVADSTRTQHRVEVLGVGN